MQYHQRGVIVFVIHGLTMVSEQMLTRWIILVFPFPEWTENTQHAYQSFCAPVWLIPWSFHHLFSSPQIQRFLRLNSRSSCPQLHQSETLTLNLISLHLLTTLPDCNSFPLAIDTLNQLLFLLAIDPRTSQLTSSTAPILLMRRECHANHSTIQETLCVLYSLANMSTFGELHTLKHW